MRIGSVIIFHLSKLCKAIGSPYHVTLYFWWACRGNLTLTTPKCGSDLTPESWVWKAAKSVTYGIPTCFYLFIHPSTSFYVTIPSSPFSLTITAHCSPSLHSENLTDLARSVFTCSLSTSFRIFFLRYGVTRNFTSNAVIMALPKVSRNTPYSGILLNPSTGK